MSEAMIHFETRFFKLKNKTGQHFVISAAFVIRYILYHRQARIITALWIWWNSISTSNEDNCIIFCIIISITNVRRRICPSQGQRKTFCSFCVRSWWMGGEGQGKERRLFGNRCCNFVTLLWLVFSSLGKMGQGRVRRNEKGLEVTTVDASTGFWNKYSGQNF